MTLATELRESGLEWAGATPAHWQVRRLKDMVRVVNGFPFDSSDFSKDEAGQRLIRIRDLSSDADPVYYRGPAVPSARVLDGDLLIGMDGDFNVAWWNGGTALLNQRLCCLRPVCDIDKRFLYYVLPLPLKVVNDLTYFTTVKHLSSGQIASLSLALPSLAMQRAIAAFLDRKTAAIDALIAKKERQIELLQEKREAVISQAVTKGLDPSVAMKESGIGWLREIPSSWTLTRLGVVATVVRGASPRPAGDSRFFCDEPGVPWITVGEITKDEAIYLDSTECYLTSLGRTLSRTIQPGTLLLSNSGATLGVPKITRIMGCINDGSVAFEGLREDVAPLYLFFFLKSLTRNFRERTRQGAGQPNLNTSIVRSTPIPLPPPSDQKAIVAFLEAALDESRRQQGIVSQQIDLLREYRQALISAAVTGKIDIPAEEAA